LPRSRHRSGLRCPAPWNDRNATQAGLTAPGQVQPGCSGPDRVIGALLTRTTMPGVWARVARCGAPSPSKGQRAAWSALAGHLYSGAAVNVLIRLSLAKGRPGARRVSVHGDLSCCAHRLRDSLVAPVQSQAAPSWRSTQYGFAGPPEPPPPPLPPMENFRRVTQRRFCQSNPGLVPVAPACQASRGWR
jgi:hypothetical protein